MIKIKEKNFYFMAEFEGYESFDDFLITHGLSKEDGEFTLIEKTKYLEVGFNVYDFINSCFTNVYSSKEIMIYSDDTHNYCIGVHLT